MANQKSKQISKNLSAFVAVNGFSANSGSGNVTTAITTALATASDSGGSVPVQQSTSGGVGVQTSSPANRVEIYDATTKQKFVDSNGNEVYGRMTFSNPNYTLTYYTLVNGTETAYSFGSTTSIDFEFGYVFSFKDLPLDAIKSIKSRRVSDDPAGSNIGTPYFEQLTVSALNTLSNLSFAPKSATQVRLTVNGQVLYAVLNFTVTGQAISISAGQITANGFDIETTDVVFAEYFR